MSLDKDNKEKLFSVVENTSENIENENLQKLKKVFPQFVKDGEIDFDAMQAFLKKEGVLAGEEKYGLNWSGKSNAFKAIRTPSTGTLIPEKDKSKNWDETENIFIEGDNLEVLKLLQKGYKDKVKMIYIDPPYNTGKDFVYKDNFTQGVADYYEQTGQMKGGIKMTANTEKNGRYHSDWLTMMYPRLFLARNLLKEDGVIFVSIDDNEVANSRMVMDEVFGEENFLAQMVWLNKEGGGGSDSKNFKTKHEYILVYSKDIETNPIKGIDIENDDDYSGQDEFVEDRGKYKLIKLESGSLGYVQSLDYPIISPDNSTIYPNKDNKKIKRWRWSKKKLDWGIINKFVEFKKDQNGDWQVYTKQYFKVDNENKSITRKLPPLSVVEKFSSTMASKQLQDLFKEQKIFDYSKPVFLMKYILQISTDNNDLVLDFFAGSGTTSHSVMELNSEDKGNRKWICVQLPEIIPEESAAYKLGHKTISEISRERIRRAGDKVGKGDIGFKSYRLSNSNYRKWNDVKDGTDELLNQSKLFIESPLIDNFVPENVVYEIALKEGFDLNVKLKQESGDLKAHVLEDVDRRLFVTFSDKVAREMVEQLKPSSDDLLVCFDSVLSDTDKVNIGRIINLKVI